MWRTDGRTDRRTERRTDGPTKQGVESRCTRLKKNNFGALKPRIRLTNLWNNSGLMKKDRNPKRFLLWLSYSTYSWYEFSFEYPVTDWLESRGKGMAKWLGDLCFKFKRCNTLLLCFWKTSDMCNNSSYIKLIQLIKRKHVLGDLFQPILWSFCILPSWMVYKTLKV